MAEITREQVLQNALLNKESKEGTNKTAEAVKAASPEQPVAYASADYITDAEVERQQAILDIPTEDFDISFEDIDVVTPTERGRRIISSKVLSERIKDFFGSVFEDVVSAPITKIDFNNSAGGISTFFKCTLVFTPKRTKIPDNSVKFHNIIEIGNGKKKSTNSIINQIGVYTAHSNGKYFKLNDTTKKVLEKFIPDNFFEEKEGKRIINWEKYEKGDPEYLKKFGELVSEDKPQILQGNINNTITLSYNVQIDILKVLPKIMKFDTDDGTREVQYILENGGVCVTSMNPAYQDFGIAVIALDKEMASRERATYGTGFITSNNVAFGANVR